MRGVSGAAYFFGCGKNDPLANGARRSVVARMKKPLWFLLVLAAGACTRPNATLAGGVGGNAPASGDADGGIGGADGGSDDGGATAPAGDMATTPPLPVLSSASYAATSTGLLADSCTVPPDDDLGIWSLSVVTPSVWNVTLAAGLAPVVLNRMGNVYAGQVAETGMPIYGCTMRETYKVSLTPTSTTQAQGRLDTVFDALAGDCSLYEPVLPCTQSYAVRLIAE